MNDTTINVQEQLIQELERQLKETKIQLEAWQKTFGTSQLTHAAARLEAAERRARVLDLF